MLRNRHTSKNAFFYLARAENLVITSLYIRFPEAGMYSNPQKLSAVGVAQLRREAGVWLRQLREARGLSQRNLADRVGAEYYTFVSQLESGRGRIPPDRYLLWAEALGVEPRRFVRTLLRYYDPVTHGILFGEDDARERGEPVLAENRAAAEHTLRRA
jgi:transcriptional regulator with XRE-family HTH domain